MDSAILVAIISGVVALSSAALSVWTQRRTDATSRATAERVDQLEEQRQLRAEQRTKDQLAEQIQVRYREPLLLSAFELQSRIYNMVEGGFRLRSGPEHDYLIEHTQYLVAQYLGWVEVMRREIQFLDLGATERTRSLNQILERITVAFSTTYFPPPFRLFRGQQRAIAGEVIHTESLQPTGRQLAVIGFSEFARRLQDGEPAFVRWFRAIESDLEEWAGGDDTASPRLAALQNALVDLVNFFDPQRERFPGKMWRIALPYGGQPSALPTATAIDELPSGTVKDDVATEVDGLGDDQHFDWEDQPWKIQTSGHPVRFDTPEYVASRQKMNEMTRGATGLIYGEGPYHNHHGGSLWLKDDEGWFIVRNQAGIESSAMFCADPAKVDLLRLNAKRLYDLLPPGIKEELDPGGLLLDTPIHDAAQVAKWADSVFNAGVPLPRGLHIGVLPADETQNSSNAADTHLAGTQLAGIHHYPTPIAEIQLFKYDDFHLWVTDQQGKPAAVAPLAERGSGDGRVQVLYATPGSHLAELKDAAERDGHPLILNPDHPLSKQAYKNQVP